MNVTTVKSIRALKIFGLILYAGALPLLVGVTGCTTGDRYEQSSGDDYGTSSRIRATLAQDSQYKYDGVSVETYKGTAQLSGFVNSRDQKNRAADLTRRVPGVKQVVNNITVRESIN